MADAPIIPALIGPTGAGKSAVAMQVAATVGAEIVAVDAFTVYRGMDVGTAKPPPQDRRRVPHHLVDVLDPAETCTVQWFQTAARAAIDEVVLRGRVPLLVGGSGLYFRAVVDPLEFPPTDPGVRSEIEQRFRDEPEAAHAQLTAVDPAAAARMEPTNARRAIRALEVLALTGRPFSEFRRAWERWEPVYPGLRVVGVQVARPDLSSHLDERVDQMMSAGWLEECRALVDGPISATARQAIGYSELLDHLEGRASLDDAVERTKARTRQYAARQSRWFGKDPRVEWVSADEAPQLLRTLCAS